MKNKLENGLFIFRRDLRIIDNICLNSLFELCNNIYTIFIFTTEQVVTNKYKSNNAVQFMIESLEDLASDISRKGGKLYTFYGDNEKIISECIKAFNIDVVGFNLDITPYSRIRDMKIVELCQKMNIFVKLEHDYYLHTPGTILTGNCDTYQKFTPYYDVACKIPVPVPVSNIDIHFKTSNKNVSNKITLSYATEKFTKINPNILLHGGRKNAINQIQIAKKNIKYYSSTRDDISRPTSMLSPYIKFGCLSIREIFKEFNHNSSFVRQLYWRDFYANILYAFPYVLGSSLKPKYDKIKWSHNEDWFNAWKIGATGFPILDATMRQLNETGWTHNRGRMIASSMLTKILLIDWRKGEKYYAQQLLDYDVANNSGGWQWSAGSGADATPYFRIFNPWRQAIEHDPRCEYIKKWIPELKDVPIKDIYNWENVWMNYKDTGYPEPICNYSKQRDKALQMYKKALVK